MPVVTVSEDDAGNNAKMLVKGSVRAATGAALVRAAIKGHFKGYCFDLTRDEPADLVALSRTFASIKKQFAQNGLETCVVTNTHQLAGMDQTFLSLADKVILKVFRGIGKESFPAPLAPQNWFKQQVDAAERLVARTKLVVAVGTGGQNWASGAPVPQSVDYQTVMQEIGDNSGKVSFAKPSLNPRASYVDGKGVRHDVWFLDAVSAFNQISTAVKTGVSGVAVWGIGREDPSIWPVLKRKSLTVDAAGLSLTSIDLGNLVVYSGTGPFLHMDKSPILGARNLVADRLRNLFIGQTYVIQPSPYTVKRWGHSPKNLLALTFDDGPDRPYTEQILKILSDYGIKATFFLVGNQMLKHPGLVRDIAQEGSDIGAHTFYHPHLAKVSNYRIKAELNIQQRLFASLLNRHVVLFRPPYIRGEGPLEAARVQKLKLINSLGYVIVSSPIVSEDWEFKNPEKLANYVVGQVISGNGSVIQMHDGGGDRSTTVKALPLIIDKLRAAGYRFGSISDVMGAPRSELMPLQNGSWLSADATIFYLVGSIEIFLKYFVGIAIAMGVMRVLALLVLANLRRQHVVRDSGFLPPVSVIVPAYNEEKVIVRTIKSILDGNYPDLEVIFVNDGSTDHTLRNVVHAFDDDRRVRIMTQKNQGKWKAANTALSATNRKFVVCVDADTVVDSMAIRRLIPHFSDPRVGAVAGNVKVGNRNNLLTRLQALEYITAQNIDRRAFECINGMTVVPGAIGAWRVRAVEIAGAFSNHTMAEDADLTVSVLRVGYRVTFEQNAYAYTEAPENVYSFLTQRLRWTLGMMQMAWKHRAAATEGKAVGLVSFPDLLVFGVISPLIAPLIDITLLLTLINVIWSTPLGAPISISYNSLILIAGYILLPLLDVLVAVSAFRFEHTEDRRLLLLIPFQRIFYRQLQYFSVFRSFWQVLTGHLAKWGKLERYASVKKTFSFQKPEHVKEAVLISWTSDNRSR